MIQRDGIATKYTRKRGNIKAAWTAYRQYEKIQRLQQKQSKKYDKLEGREDKQIKKDYICEVEEGVGAKQEHNDVEEQELVKQDKLKRIRRE